MTDKSALTKSSLYFSTCQRSIACKPLSLNGKAKDLVVAIATGITALIVACDIRRLLTVPRTAATSTAPRGLMRRSSTIHLFCMLKSLIMRASCNEQDIQ